jgi:hypothetical protein
MTVYDPPDLRDAREAFVEAFVEFAVAVAEARETFESDAACVRWLRRQGMQGSPEDLAALWTFGGEPERLAGALHELSALPPDHELIAHLRRRLVH